MTTPADIIADTIDNWHDQMCDYLDGHHGMKPDTQERCIIAALDAAGYQIVPKAEPPDAAYSFTFRRDEDGEWQLVEDDRKDER